MLCGFSFSTVCVCVHTEGEREMRNYIVGPAGTILTQSTLIFSSHTLGNLAAPQESNNGLVITPC